MELFNKLFATTILAAGLIAAPLLDAWGISAFILVKDNHINCIWGDHHAIEGAHYSQYTMETEEKTFKKNVTKKIFKLLSNKNVAFILESTPERIQEYVKHTNIVDENFGKKERLLIRLASMYYAQPSYKASIKLADWRNGEIDEVLYFFMHKIEQYLDKYYDHAIDHLKQLIKAPSITNDISTTISTYLEEITQLSPAGLGNNLLKKELIKGICPEAGFKKKRKDFINDLRLYYRQHHLTFEQLIAKIKKQHKKIKKITASTNLPYAKLAKRISTKLEFALKELIELQKNSSHTNVFKTFINKAIKNQDISHILDAYIIQEKSCWLETLLEPLPDFGFITTIKTMQTQHPVTFTYVGNNHAKKIVKYFTKKEGYSCILKKAHKNNKSLTAEEYQEFFTTLRNLTKEKAHDKKRKNLNNRLNQKNEKKKKL